ncbi:MAG TPA: DUF971 domain-containing protein [Melioribacteraceae bacterium]|nr:DUF971 domain-containing protein [Melioribacteraceae bacterium]
MRKPKQIKLNKQESLIIVWDNDNEQSFPLKFLRDETPDAQNKGETILWRHYPAPAKGPDKPGKYEVQKIELVGNYALSITWKDGYNYGIYSWDLLKKLGEYLEVKESLHQDFEHDHNHENGHKH